MEQNVYIFQHYFPASDLGMEQTELRANFMKHQIHV